MPRLVEGLSRFFGRVEILALGLENVRRAGEAALARGMPLEAREHAREILAHLPGSPLGLALWADAAEDAWLDDEAKNALVELSRAVPWRADVWLRLGQAALRLGDPTAREALERAAAAPEERESSRIALLELCDLDLSAGDPTRAAHWLDRVTGDANDRDLALRRTECALAMGQLASAREAAQALGTDPEDGRGACAVARIASEAGDASRAIELALRAYIQEAPGAADLLASLVAASREMADVDRVRRVVMASDALDEPAWAAAFAFAQGRREDARRALLRGLRAGDSSAAAALLALCRETRDIDALHALAARDPKLLPDDLRTIREAAALIGAGRDVAALDRLDHVSGDAGAWADELRAAVVGGWLPQADAAPAQAAWPMLLGELRRSARTLDRLDLLGAIEALAVERERPLRVAVVGEFNAGKSTFLNALLGEDVAPTGVLPTTATLHWVAWAPDPFARVVVRNAPDRVVQHAELKPTLRALVEAGSKVERVFIYAPIERLKRVEILDTPGFNAPDPEHIAAARVAFDEAHVAIWLLDATGPLKESERRVLVEIRGLGVPVQILVNKSDRLTPPELDRVLTHIREGLLEAKISSHSPAIAFSARLSLRGRLGDAAALQASGWAQVEALLSEQIVDESDALRERALRRKAARIATELAATAATRATEERAARQAAREQNEAMRAAALRLRRDKRELAEAVEHAIEPGRRLLMADLRPFAELSDEHRRSAPGFRAYVEERFVARLLDPIVQAIAHAAGVQPPDRAVMAVRAVLAGAASAQETPERIDPPFERILAAAVELFASALTAEAEEPEPPAPAAAIEHRALALRDALRA